MADEISGTKGGEPNGRVNLWNASERGGGVIRMRYALASLSLSS